MFKETIKTLQQNKSAPCVSIILPMHRSKPESLKNETRVKNGVKKARSMLNKLDHKKKNKNLLNKLSEIATQIDYNYTKDGLAIFLSPGFSKMVHLPFPVKEKIHVGTQFVTRDIVYAANRNIDYWVLHLSANHTRLYKGKGESIEEIQDNHFPTHYEEEFERSKTSQLPTEYGDDEGMLPNVRIKQYFQKVDKALGAYLKFNKAPLLLISIEKYKGYFVEVSKHKGAIAETITGNYDHLSPAQLAKKAWPKMKKYQEKRLEELKNRLRETVGTGKATSGIDDVWEAVKEKRGQQLIVEKGYQVGGYVNEDKYNLYLSPVQGKKMSKIDDAVNTLINDIIEQQGEVYFFENDALKEYEHIALIKRY